MSNIILNKESITTKANELVKQVEEGYVNPLNAYIKVKYMEELAKTTTKKLKDLAIDEAYKYTESRQGISLYGADVKVRNGAGRWKFDHIPEWVALNEQIKALEEKYKTAYKMDKAGDIFLTAEGEIVPKAHYTEYAETISVRLKK